MSPYLNNSKNIAKWEVDLENENKILTILSTGIKANEVIKLIEIAGFETEQIPDHDSKSCH